MRVNGESIYGTTASLFENLGWGRSTTKGNTLYLHVFNWPRDGKLHVPGLVSNVQKVYLLSDPKKELSCDYQEEAAIISLPENAINPYATVIALEFPGKPKIVPPREISKGNDIIP